MTQRKCFLVFLFVLFLSFPNLSAAGSEDLLRDDWYVMEQSDLSFGYGNDQLFKTEEGYYYKGFFQLNLDFAGTPFIYLEHIDVWTDHEFRLTHALRVSDADGAQSRYETFFSYAPELTEVNCTITDATGKQFNSYWNWPEIHPLYSSSSLVDKLLREESFIVGGEYSFETWNWESLASTEFRVLEETIINYGDLEVPVFIVTQKTGEILVKAHIDLDGRSYITETVGQDIIINKVEPDKMPELQSMAADILLVPANLVVKHPYRSTSSLITVNWQDIPLEKFNLEDNRQKVVEIIDDFSVRLAINSDQQDFSGKVRLPVSDPQFTLYLADTDYINPSLPLVEELVKTILDGEEDAWVATKLILDWVYQNMTSKMIARTLTTSEILANREGKCAEYAIVFAALTRAAGLPTRIALGERYMGNIWVGHLWNEVWLGEWVAVDPSHNQIAPDALLIKLISSDTVLGTQDLRFALVNKLGIIIEDVQIPDNEKLPNGKTGLVGQHYSNAEFNCEITVPNNWSAEEAEEQGFPMLVMYDPDYPDFSAILLMLSVPHGTKAEQLMSTRIVSLPALLPNFELQEEKTGIIDGENASIASWTFNEVPLFVQENQILIKGDVAYLFVFTGPADTWLEQQAVIEMIAGGFRAF